MTTLADHNLRILRGNRVLIADDDPDFRLLLRTHLEAHGFIVVGEASNGAHAISMAFKKDPDFLTLDSRMPHVGGEQALEHIAEIRPRTQVVVVSGTVERQPEWADVFVSKMDLDTIGPLLQKMREAG
ncbi:MAG: two-component system, chemotaxis family, chemotaxis protein CheY [Actinomycetota bacterium]|nr:two-component system, chemotaxis family, chemotaxis protein CheY [Actinomycetota bacterium]